MNFKVFAALGMLFSALAMEEKDGRILGALSTITHLTFSTVVTTVPYTCYQTINSANVCSRRRRALAPNHRLLTSHREGNPIELSGTQASDPTRDHPPLVDILPDEGASRAGRFAVTVWSSVTTTYTVTSTSTNTGLTYSVSFLCSAASAVFPNPCGR